MVAKAAYDALKKLDHQLTTGTERKIQSIHYVNLDAEATAAFIEVFSNQPTSEQRGKVSRGDDPSPDTAAANLDLQKTSTDGMLVESLSVRRMESESSTTDSNNFATVSTQKLLPNCRDPYRMVTSSGISVQIYCGNLLDEKVDAIVNPANSHLIHSGGAARAIAEAAGEQLEKECRAYIGQYKELKVTQPMHTTAGKMYPPVKYVIHVAGPSAAQFPNPDDLYKAVYDTFHHCVLHANNVLHVSSLSVPAISSGE